MSKTHPTFSEQRRQEEDAFKKRRQELVAAYKSDPNRPLYGGVDPELAAMLGGAVALHRFREVCRVHRLNPEKLKDFERAKMLTTDIAAKKAILFEETARDMGINLNDKADIVVRHRAVAREMGLDADYFKRDADRIPPTHPAAPTRPAGTGCNQRIPRRSQQGIGLGSSVPR
jgi:hypothetical protein